MEKKPIFSTAPLIHRQWSIGGTRITNFNKNELDNYVKAIEEYGDSGLVISEQAYCGMNDEMILPSHHALHDIRGHHGNLGAFWDLFKKIGSRPKEVAEITHQWVTGFGWENTIFNPSDFVEFDLLGTNDIDGDVFLGITEKGGRHILKGLFLTPYQNNLRNGNDSHHVHPQRKVPPGI
jgi:hypothetical protein